MLPAYERPTAGISYSIKNVLAARMAPGRENRILKRGHCSAVMMRVMVDKELSKNLSS